MIFKIIIIIIVQKIVIGWEWEAIIVSQFGYWFLWHILPLTPRLNSLICKISIMDNILYKTHFNLKIL